MANYRLRTFKLRSNELFFATLSLNYAYICEVYSVLSRTELIIPLALLNRSILNVLSQREKVPFYVSFTKAHRLDCALPFVITNFIKIYIYIFSVHIFKFLTRLSFLFERYVFYGPLNLSRGQSFQIK